MSAAKPNPTPAPSADTKEGKSESERLKKLKDKEKEIKNRIRKLRVRESKEERERETRRQFLIGKAIANQIKENKLLREWLMAILDQELVKEDDRLLFGLSVVAGEEDAIAPGDSEPDDAVEMGDQQSIDSSALVEADASVSVQESEVSVAPESAVEGEDLAGGATDDREAADLDESIEVDGVVTAGQPD